jgi:hypothetical protein
MRERSFESGQEAATSLFERNRLDGAGVDAGHAAGDFLVPGRCNGFVLRVVQTLDERASKVGAFCYGKSKRFFQKLGGFLGHEFILPPKSAIEARAEQPVPRQEKGSIGKPL